MRLMLRFTIPVEKGNEAAADGSISQVIQDLVDQVQAESAYFYVQDGKRAGTIVFEESGFEKTGVHFIPSFSWPNFKVNGANLPKPDKRGL